MSILLYLYSSTKLNVGLFTFSFFLYNLIKLLTKTVFPDPSSPFIPITIGSSIARFNAFAIISVSFSDFILNTIYIILTLFCPFF